MRRPRYDCFSSKRHVNRTPPICVWVCPYSFPRSVPCYVSASLYHTKLWRRTNRSIFRRAAEARGLQIQCRLVMRFSAKFPNRSVQNSCKLLTIRPWGGVSIHLPRRPTTKCVLRKNVHKCFRKFELIYLNYRITCHQTAHIPFAWKTTSSNILGTCVSPSTSGPSCNVGSVVSSSVLGY